MHLRNRSLRGRRVVTVLVAVASLRAATPAGAQGVTTAGIRGTVRTPTGANVDSAVVSVANELTGYVWQSRVHNGAFFVQGLESDVPYSVDIRRIGFVPLHERGVFLSLGERRDVAFTLVRLGALDTLRVVANPEVAARSRGVGATISDSMLRRLPTLNSDLYDFLRIVPQAGTKFGPSGAGASFRFNTYLIDGISDRGQQGNNSASKGISLDAVKEYDVLLSPFDPRYGDFTGLLVNAVTKSGTNEFHGSAYTYVRNADLTRSGSFIAASGYHRELYGFSLGGPIVRDRVQFFVAPEVQRSDSPARGIYVGQPADSPIPLPVSVDSISRFISLLRARGLDPGDGSRFLQPNPNVTGFARLDVALPELASRIVVRGNVSRMDMSTFQRSTATAFPLTSVAGITRTEKRTAAVQVFSQLSPTLFNELDIGRSSNPIGGANPPGMPSVVVTVQKATLSAGPNPGGQGSASSALSTEIGDYVVFQAAPNNTIGFGAHVDFFQYRITGTRLGLGQWNFASLSDLELGKASTFKLDEDEGSASAPVAGAEPSAYVSDDWRIGNGLSALLGVRVDGLAFDRHPDYNVEVDSVFGRRTDDYPVFRPQWSPRIGFTWDVGQRGITTVRGGAGVFTGRPPLGWLVGPMRSIGSGVRQLSCSGAAVPAFTPYPAPQPTTCANGAQPSDGALTLVDRHLNMAQTLRTSLGVDRQLSQNTTATIEALYSRIRSDFVFENLALGEPVGVDAHGRVLYGTFDASGTAIPTVVPGAKTFSEATDLRNQSGGSSLSITGSVHRAWTDRFSMDAAYTYSRVRDVQSLTIGSTNVPSDIWASERPTGGRRDDPSPGVSSFEIPHRIVVAASYAAGWKRQTTDISLFYIGESGAPFTYTDSTSGKLTGDLNADGSAADDPIYVPRNARDPSEIAFSPDSAAAQGTAFDRFIDGTPCLRRQRGRIMERNSCRGPWVNTLNLAVRQSLPALGSHAPTVQLDVFNLLNLLNKSWGLLEVPNAAVLQYTGRTPGGEPVFTFNPNFARNNHQNVESSYQLQLSLRFTF